MTKLLAILTLGLSIFLYGCGDSDEVKTAKRNCNNYSENLKIDLQKCIEDKDYFKELRFKQSDLEIKGHAIEIRVYAEDPCNNFLPDIGNIEVYNKPKGIGVRVDDAIEAGMDIPIYYDPMISKLIVHGNTRSEAIDKMINAINDYDIVGVKTTLPFCKFAINHDSFRSGNFDTRFVQLYFSDVSVIESSDAEDLENFSE